MVYQCHLTKFAGINRTSYRAMFGGDPKVGLTSSSLPPEILERLQSEDDLLPLHHAPLPAITEPTSAHNNEPPPAPNEPLPPSPPATHQPSTSSQAPSMQHHDIPPPLNSIPWTSSFKTSPINVEEHVNPSYHRQKG